MTAETRTRIPRADALPEHFTYTDDGCDLAPRCLECPLRMCRYDVPLGGGRRLLNELRDREIVRLHRDERFTVDALAVRYRVSQRTIFRVLAGHCL